MRGQEAKANAGVQKAELTVNGGLIGPVSWGTGGTCLSRYFVKLLNFKQEDSNIYQDKREVPRANELS
jgi:hypothetical protein